MTANRIENPPPRRHWGIGIGALVFLALFVFLFVRRASDGPLTSLIPGGTLRSGALVTETVADWPAVLGAAGACVGGSCAPMEPIELELVARATSRWTGIMVHDGTLYVPCDLGFMWARFEGTQRHVLQLTYLLKRWHKDAVDDGQAVIRFDGRRYPLQAVKVTDPELEARLKAQLEEMARAWVAPAPLADAPAEPPNDIWFFRMESRS